jgi:hypothetical protein
MHMVGNTIDNDRFLFFGLNDTGYVFEYIISPWFLEQCISSFNGKNILDVNLRISVGHVAGIRYTKIAIIHSSPKQGVGQGIRRIMPPRWGYPDAAPTGLINDWDGLCYNHFAPLGR